MRFKRRALLSLGAALLVAPAVRAQPTKQARIGFLFGPARGTSQVPDLFVSALRQAGWREGANLAIEWRFAHGQAERLFELATELVGLGVQLIVAPTNLEAGAAQRVTRTVPIVMLFAADPVGAGLAQSVARPGNNVTGVIYADPDFGAKTMQLLRELLPGMRRVGHLYPAGMFGTQRYSAETEAAGERMGIRSFWLPIASPTDMQAALRTAKSERIDALRVSYTGIIQAVLPDILDFAAANRIPALYSVATPVERGGLMSYSPRIAENASLGAGFVDRILKGAKPAELPFQYPRAIELVINLKTARALGVVVPQSLLVRADRVIE